ncbi:MAG: hypothetical protein C4547_03750 [Phycisphaerales bacterium]|nr:MAG: hypothetical protein C4547_03750 [Phycisphaerales bacterium]
MRSRMTAGGTKERCHLAAAVPSRGLKGKAWILSNSDSRATASVRSKSASVSPGKPTMMSVLMAGRSRADRTRAIMSRNAATVYWRFIRRRIASLPD